MFITILLGIQSAAVLYCALFNNYYLIAVGIWASMFLVLFLADKFDAWNWPWKNFH